MMQLCIMLYTYWTPLGQTTSHKGSFVGLGLLTLPKFCSGLPEDEAGEELVATTNRKPRATLSGIFIFTLDFHNELMPASYYCLT